MYSTDDARKRKREDQHRRAQIEVLTWRLVNRIGKPCDIKEEIRTLNGAAVIELFREVLKWRKQLLYGHEVEDVRSIRVFLNCVADQSKERKPPASVAPLTEDEKALSLPRTSRSLP